jgi:putative transposase
MLMRRAGLVGLPGRRRRRLVHDTAFAGDLVDRNFARNRPNELWVTDITEHPTREGKVYCAVVLDVHSRRVVGWSIDSSQTAALATNALGMAIANRSPRSDGGTVIHSDHGVQFTSWAFTDRARDSGLVPSMGSIGDCLLTGHADVSPAQRHTVRWRLRGDRGHRWYICSP